MSVFFKEIGKTSLFNFLQIFQDQGCGYALRVSSSSLCGVSPVKIPPKCWGFSNLLSKLPETLSEPQVTLSKLKVTLSKLPVTLT